MMSATRKRTPYVKAWWTTAQEAYLRASYAEVPMGQLMAVLNRPATAIHKKAQVLGLRRSVDFVTGEHGGRMRPGNQRGRATRFGARPDRGHR